MRKARKKSGIPDNMFLLAAMYERDRRREAVTTRRATRYNERQEDIGARKIVRTQNAKTVQLKRVMAIKRKPSAQGITMLHKWLASPDTDPMVKVTAAELLSRWALNDLRGDLRVRRQF